MVRLMATSCHYFVITLSLFLVIAVTFHNHAMSYVVTVVSETSLIHLFSLNIGFEFNQERTD